MSLEDAQYVVAILPLILDGHSTNMKSEISMN
jgi:hypothetical protein